MAGCSTPPCGRDNEHAPGPGLVRRGTKFVCHMCYVMPLKFPQRPQSLESSDKRKNDYAVPEAPQKEIWTPEMGARPSKSRKAKKK